MNEKQIKKLATEHYYFGKNLTLRERNILRKTKYKRLIKEDNMFDQIFENAIANSETPKEFDPPKCLPMTRHSKVNQTLIRDLVDQIENKFNLDIDNPSPRKYLDIDLSQLKSYIENYANKETNNDETESFLLSCIKRAKSPMTVMHHLYFWCR
jgi:hypothetical protein